MFPIFVNMGNNSHIFGFKHFHLQIRGITADKKKKRKKKKIGDWKENDDEDENQQSTTISDELQEMYAKSQQKLVAKTKLYEKMQKGEIEDVEDYRGETRLALFFCCSHYPLRSSM